MEKMKKKNIWMEGMMGLIVGDALGIPVQFKTRTEVAHAPIKDMVGFGTFNMPAGTWSDDSSMALATVASLKEKQKVDCDNIMEKFVMWCDKGEYTPFGEPFDEGITCMNAIANYKSTKDVDTCGKTGEYANGNGALMRIMPICLYVYEKETEGHISEEEAIGLIHKVAALTHNHRRSNIACGLYYFMIRAVLGSEGSFVEKLQKGIDYGISFYKKNRENFWELGHYRRIFYLNEFASTNVVDVRSSGYVVDSLEAALWCLLTTDNLEAAVLKAVNLGGDTDTIGAITGGLAALQYGYDEIPKKWLERIQKKEWIEEILREM